MEKSVFVFDLDGVITDPKDSSVDQRTVDVIAGLLYKGNLVAVNTGRSYEWVQQNLLETLRSVGDALQNLAISCEKGGDFIEWTNNAFVQRPSRFALPAALQTQCKELFETHQEMLTTMFWDATKRTMATIEKIPDADLTAYHAEQEQLITLLRTAFAEHDVRIDPTTIATDVESMQAGKHAGAELIFEWVGKQAAVVSQYISVGDSISDYEMARYFAQQKSKSVFVFVGAKDATFTQELGVRLVRTEASYAAGTLEYFSNHIQYFS
jgi:hydroxymethylpyrimidine pyrophosphatase-like HAD family hydrolase